MNWLRQIFSRRRRYDDLSVSIQEHLEGKVEDLMDEGMSREEAERAARREFGNVTRIEERSREVWQSPTLESIWADVRYASRQIQKSPRFLPAWPQPRRFLDPRFHPIGKEPRLSQTTSFHCSNPV